jgi:hypothetical protein
MISGRSCAIQNTVSHYSPVIIAPFVDKFIAPASRKKMVAALCAEDLRKARGDVFIGEAMEAVAAQAFRMQLLWNGIMICNCTVAAVKRCIEAGNLRELRKTRENVADRREIVRLVQGRKWHITLKPSEHLRVYQNRAVVLGAAMYDAVADGARRHALLFPQPSTG